MERVENWGLEQTLHRENKIHDRENELSVANQETQTYPIVLK